MADTLGILLTQHLGLWQFQGPMRAWSEHRKEGTGLVPKTRLSYNFSFLDCPPEPSEPPEGLQRFPIWSGNSSTAATTAFS